MIMPDFVHEKLSHSRGYRSVAGVDEAGRGPLAGPVVAAAVILPFSYSCSYLDDSKKLTKRRREQIHAELTTDPRVHWAVGIVEADVIDEINILRATHQAMAVALELLPVQADFAWVDGLPVKGLCVPHEALVKGDSRSLSIAAASVIAKVTRDRIMGKISEEHPEYGFAQHQGYGTRKHLEALRKYGPCRYHRRSFQPVSQLALQAGGREEWFSQVDG